jgi:branched-chain amino acid aminotransferase
VLVEGYDPADRSREQKRAARAWAEAAEAAAGGEALLVAADGAIGETTRANVFAILGRTVVTPRVAGILPGVTRSFVLEHTGAVERTLPLADLRVADGAFLTTAGRGIVPLADVGGRRIGKHPLVDELAAAWRAL